MTDSSSDDDLLGQVRAAVTSADPPPASLRDASIRALTWDTDLEALALVFDSATEPMAVRSDDATRDLQFGEGDLVIDLAITAGDGGTTALVGSVSPGAVDVVLLQPGAAARPISIDEHGRFRLAVSGSVASIVANTADARRLKTELFSLDPDHAV